MGIGMKTRTPSQGTFKKEKRRPTTETTQHDATTAAEITVTASKPTTKKK